MIQFQLDQALMYQTIFNVILDNTLDSSNSFILNEFAFLPFAILFFLCPRMNNQKWFECDFKWTFYNAFM